MQCEYRDNASGRTTAAESIADAWARDGRDVDYREVGEATWQPLTDWRPYRAGTAALYAPATPIDPAADQYVPPDPMLEIDRDTMALLGALADLRRENESAAVAAAVASFHAGAFGEPATRPAAGASAAGRDPFPRTAGRAPRIPHQPKETTTMRIAVKSAGGIVECFLHADNATAGAKDAARQIAEDYGLPTDLELWSDLPDGGTPRRLGELRFVALAADGTVLELD